MTDTEVIRARLEPCPFCGGKPMFGKIGKPDHEYFGGHFIACTNLACEASTNLRWGDKTDPTPLLAEQWNRRDGKDAEIEQLRDWLGYLQQKAGQYIDGDCSSAELDAAIGDQYDVAGKVKALRDEIARLRTVAGEMAGALEASERALLIHVFMPRGYETQDERDTCAHCGSGFRAKEHLRTDEGQPSDIRREGLESIREALAKWRQEQD